MVKVLCRPIRLSLRQARLVCAVVAAAACVALGVSTFWNLHAWYITSDRDWWRGGLYDGEFVVSWTSADMEVDDAGNDVLGLSFQVDQREDRSVSLAWRPYHLGVNGGFHMDDVYHGLAVPLWLVALPALIGAACLHGRVNAVRRAD